MKSKFFIFRKAHVFRGGLSFLLLLLCACNGGDDAARQQALPTAQESVNAVAYIGDRPVTEAEWQQARAYAQATMLLLAEPGTVLDEATALQGFIEDIVISDEAALAGFALDEEHIAQEESWLLGIAGASVSDLEAVLAEVGLSQTNWHTEFKRSLLAAEYLEDVILADLTPSETVARRQSWLDTVMDDRDVRFLLKPEPFIGLRVGDMAPDFEIPLLGGGTTWLSDHRGEAVVLNFWATWCHPCREEMPILDASYTELSGEGLTVLAVNVGEDEDAVAAYTKELGLVFPIALDANQSLSRRYRVYGMPTTFFINQEGVIDYVAVGARPSAELKSRIASLVDTQ